MHNHRHTRWKRWVPPLILCGLVVIITLLSRGDLTGSGFHYDTPNDEMPTALWLAIHLIGGGLMVVCWKKSPGIPGIKCWQESPDISASVWIGRQHVNLSTVIIGFAILFRLILLPSVPIHENDFYRYLWDGKSIAAGVNPYEFEPGALQMRDLDLTEPTPDTQFPSIIWQGREFSDTENARLDRLDKIRQSDPTAYARIGHPAVPTIYPPVAQFVFWLVAVVFGGGLIGLKIVLLFFELGIMLLIAKLLSRFRLPTIGLVLYAWNPLVLKEFANSAHYDAVPVFFIVLAVWLATGDRQRLVAVALALAAATLAKFFAVLLVPILLPPMRWRSWIGYVIFGISCVAAWLPFALWNGIGVARVFEGLQIYNAVWEANSLLFPLLSRLVGFDSAKLLLAGALFLVVAWLTFVKPAATNVSKVQYALIVFAALFVLSPTAFPWYFCWVLPFLCVFPRWPWVLLGLLLPVAYYSDFHSASSYPWAWGTILGIKWLLWAVWGIFLGAWIFELRRSKLRARAQK